VAFLRAIRLRGFKTFARATDLPLEPGVTVVIGPNGSGKSNIADAVLWALGEQSPTALRGRSMQDVIFSGSDGRKGSPSAEVSLVFDNGNRAFPLEYEEVEITRRVHRDGASEYRVNGSLCRLADVQELIASVGLGREMHTIISQGKVEELLNSTPLTRRALVEEAAGLGRYKKRRQRTQAKLERVHANLEAVAAVEREVRSALRPLQLQATAAERHARLSEDLAEVQARLTLIRLAGLEDAAQNAQSRLTLVQESREDVEGQLTALREARAAEEEGLARAFAAREAAGAHLHRAQALGERLAGRTDSLRQRRGRFEAEQARTARRLAAAEAEGAEAGESLARLGEGPGELGLRHERVAGLVARVQAQLDEVGPRLDLETEVEEGLKDQVFELEASRSRTTQQLVVLRRELRDRIEGAERLAGEQHEAAERARTLQADVQRVEAELAVAREETAAAAAAAEAGREAAAALQARLEQARAESRQILELQEERSSRGRILTGLLESRAGLPAGARALLEAQPEARPLGDLLRVSAGYERAVSAALGPLAQALVLPGTPRPSLLHEYEGPVELLWAGEGLPDPEMAAPYQHAPRPVVDSPQESEDPRGGRDLWSVVAGPSAVVQTLRRLLPSVVVTPDLAGGPSPEGGRIVTRSGELADDSRHAARRGDPGIEAVLTARGELDRLAAEAPELEVRATAAESSREAAAARLGEAEKAVLAAEEHARARERASRALQDEVELFTRRAAQGGEQAERLVERRRRDEQMAADLTEETAALEVGLEEGERALEKCRRDLRDTRLVLERLRAGARHLEQKRTQGNLMLVRLRERRRIADDQRRRAEARLSASRRQQVHLRRRGEALGALAPLVRGLEQTVAELADHALRSLKPLEQAVDQSRRDSEGYGASLKEYGRREAELQQELGRVSEALVEVQVSLAHLGDRRQEQQKVLAELCRRHLSPRPLGRADVAGDDAEALEARQEQLERRRERIGPVNPLAEQEYRELAERAGFLAEQRADLESSLAELRRVVRDLDAHIESTFLAVFEATREHFQEMVQILFPGGRGLLRLADLEVAGEGDEPEPPGDFEGGPGPGVILEIKPPKKAPRGLSLLSGGEKALAAIAFLFALFLARPCPFYILDEVEAALDDVNIGRFLSLIRRYQGETQFIVVTHQRRTMEVADTLYGVAMDGDGTSRVLSRRLTQREEEAVPG